MDPQIVAMDEGVAEDDLLFHDEKQAEPSLAYLLSRMHYPEFPEPIGVFRDVDRPTYDAGLNAQISDAIREQGEGDIAQLFTSGDTWTVS